MSVPKSLRGNCTSQTSSCRADWATSIQPPARIDCHHAVNGYFLEKDQLLRNADKLKDIPATLINGRMT